LLNQDEIDTIVEKTRQGGGDLVKLIGTSAWYAPGAAVAQMVEAIVHDQHRIFSICAYVNGEYGIKDLYLGVPVKLGRAGVEQVIEIELNSEERKLLHDSACEVRKLENGTRWYEPVLLSFGFPAPLPCLILPAQKASGLRRTILNRQFAILECTCADYQLNIYLFLLK
jgi:hypothetical protein